MNYSIEKNIFHPANLVTLSWLFVVICYFYFQGELDSLSNSTLRLIFLWVVLFSAGSILFSRIKIYVYNYIDTFTKKKYNCFFLLSILLSILLIFALINKGGGLNMDLILTLRESQENMGAATILLYLNAFSLAFFAYTLLKSSQIKSWKIVLLFVLIFIITILKTNKTGIVQLFSIFFFITYKKNILTVKNILYIVLPLVLVLFVFTLLRDSDSSGDLNLSRYLAIYLLSPLTALDLLVNNQIYTQINSFGSGTFAFFYNLMSFFGIDFERSIYYQWVYVPYPTNVFTTIANFYCDFGIMGVVIGSFLYGGFFGLVFKYQKKNSLFYTLFYALSIYILLFQFFGDMFFMYFSTIIQYLLASLVISKFFSKKIN